MSIAIPLKRIGTYVLDQLAEARDAFGAAPDGGAYATVRIAEISIAFASADGSPVEPAVLSLSEAPISPEEVALRLEPLDRKVLVAQADVKKAAPAARGKLVLRVLLADG